MIGRHKILHISLQHLVGKFPQSAVLGATFQKVLGTCLHGTSLIYWECIRRSGQTSALHGRLLCSLCCSQWDADVQAAVVYCEPWGLHLFQGLPFKQFANIFSEVAPQYCCAIHLKIKLPRDAKLGNDPSQQFRNPFSPLQESHNEQGIGISKEM